MKITTKIVWDVNGNVVEHKYYEYSGPIARCCMGGGASSAQKAVGSSQTALLNQLTQQAQEIMGSSSKAFQDLMGAFEPIVAAGPNQEGYDQPTMARLKSEAITQTGIAGRNAMTAVKQAGAAYGGGNVALPGGAQIGAETQTANIQAQAGAQELSNIEQQSQALGRQNFFQATAGILGAPQVFNPATAAGQAATGAGSAAANTQAQITQANQAGSFGAGLGSILGGIGSIVGGAAAFSGGGGGIDFGTPSPEGSLSAVPYTAPEFAPGTGGGFVT